MNGIIISELCIRCTQVIESVPDYNSVMVKKRLNQDTGYLSHQTIRPSHVHAINLVNYSDHDFEVICAGSKGDSLNLRRPYQVLRETANSIGLSVGLAVIANLNCTLSNSSIKVGPERCRNFGG